MSHLWTPEKFIDDNGQRHVVITRATTQNKAIISKDDFGLVVTSPAYLNERDETGTPAIDNTVYSCQIAQGLAQALTFEILITDFNDMYEYFHPGFRAFNAETDGASTGTDTPELPELQLVQDPVIYNRPETGYSQENQHFFRFHNPNGKSAISIPMANVDYTRFDSLNDDTHQYVVVTKSRVEVRCVSTVNEQLGLEFRFRGVTHITSAEESNNVRRITESRASEAS